MWQMAWKERSDKAQEQISLTRRSIFAFGTTFFSLGLVAYLNVWIPEPTSLNEKTVAALLSLAETIAMLYVGASVIDRSRVLTKIGEQWGNTSTNTTTDKTVTTRTENDK